MIFGAANVSTRQRPAKVVFLGCLTCPLCPEQVTQPIKKTCANLCRHRIQERSAVQGPSQAYPLHRNNTNDIFLQSSLLSLSVVGVFCTIMFEV